jgi:hypothetical protein
LKIGCIFKHEMPTDPATLEKLGLRDIPRWYRDKYGLKSINSTDTRGSRPELARCWRPDSRVPRIPLGPKYDLSPSRYVLGGVGDNQAGVSAGLSQYHPIGSTFSNLQGGYLDNAAVPNVPIASASPTSSEEQPKIYGRAPVSYRSAGKSQSWKKLDLLTQDLLPEYATSDAVSNPFRYELVTGAQNIRAQEIPGPSDYQKIAEPMTSKLLRPAFNVVGDCDIQKRATSIDGDTVFQSHDQLSVSVPRLTSSSSRTMSVSKHDDLTAYPSAPFQPLPSVKGSHAQLGSPKRKQRSRRLYQPRVIVDVPADGVPGTNESTVAATDKKDLSPTQIQDHNSHDHMVANKQVDMVSSYSSPISSPGNNSSVRSPISAWIPGSRAYTAPGCIVKGKIIKAGVSGRYEQENIKLMEHEERSEVYFTEKTDDGLEQGAEADLLNLSLNDEVRPRNGRF